MLAWWPHCGLFVGPDKETFEKAKHLQRVYTREQTLLAPYSWPVGGKKTGSWLRCSLKAIETLPLASWLVELVFYIMIHETIPKRSEMEHLDWSLLQQLWQEHRQILHSKLGQQNPNHWYVWYFYLFLLYNMWLVLGGKCKQMEHTCMIWIGIIPQWSTVSTVRLQVMLFGIDRLQRNYGLPNRKP